MQRKAPIFFVCGVLTALVAAYTLQVLRPFVAARLETVLVGGSPILFAPVVEEAARMIGLFLVGHVKGAPRGDQYRWPVFFFGVGFAFLEALIHWFGVGNWADDTPFIHVWGPWLPVLLHIGLTLVAALFIIARRPILGLSICIVGHSAHNAYVHNILGPSSPASISIAVIVQLVLMALAIAALMLAWKSRAPSMQFRTDP